MVPFKRNASRWTRWLHIYLSMFSFAALLFFAFTGLTLNHTEWIEGKQQSSQFEGIINSAWLGGDSAEVDKLMIVEYLRNTHGIRSPLSDFTGDDMECSFSFKGPGFNADGLIDRATGQYELTITRYGLVAILNDLHKGRDSGKSWSLLIDISAVLMILVSLTGFLMIFFLKKKLADALWVALAGTLAIVAVYYFFV